jgi:hypothetical protein
MLPPDVPSFSLFFDLSNDRERFLHTKLIYLLEQRSQMNQRIKQLFDQEEFERANDLKSMMENDTANYVQKLYDLCPEKINVGAYYFPFIYHLIHEKLAENARHPNN